MWFNVSPENNNAPNGIRIHVPIPRRGEAVSEKLPRPGLFLLARAPVGLDM
jgi:hypothetical protein